MAKIADLHVHTTASDGSYPPKRVLKIADEKGLAAIGIVDHDTMSGVESIWESGVQSDVEVLPGVELSCEKGGVHFDLLGYFVDPNNTILSRKLSELQENRLNRARKMTEKLQKLEIDVSLDEALRISGGGAVGRPHFAWLLYTEGHVNSVEEAFSKYLGEGEPAYVEKERLGLEEAVSLIREGGGLSILAHPSFGGLEVFEEIMEAGVDGIEVYHSMHSDDEIRKYHELAMENNLLESGGSDSHGEYTPKTPIGESYIDYEAVKKMKEEVENR